MEMASLGDGAAQAVGQGVKQGVDNENATVAAQVMDMDPAALLEQIRANRMGWGRPAAEAWLMGGGGRDKSLPGLTFEFDSLSYTSRTALSVLRRI